VASVVTRTDTIASISLVVVSGGSMVAAVDHSVTRRRHCTITTCPPVFAFAYAPVCLVEIVGGAMTTTIIHSGARGRRLTVITGKTASACAITVVRPVFVGGGAMPAAIHEGSAWRRNGTVIACILCSVEDVAITFAAVCFIEISGVTVITAILHTMARWRH